MKKILLIIVFLFSLDIAQAQIGFDQCEGANKISQWVIMLHVATTDKEVYSPEDSCYLCYSATCAGFCTIVFLYQREVNLEIWRDGIMVWSNAPPSDSSYYHEVFIGFNQLVGLDTTLDLMQFGNGNYEFRANLLCEPPHNIQLTLPFTVDGVVPVEMMTFTVESISQSGREDILLEWTTATELNNMGWHIERYDQTGWQRIGWQDGAGNSNSPKNYTYLDRTAQGLDIQYRLLQVDLDGTSKYSPIARVERIVESFTLSQNYPNPFNPRTNIEYALPEAGRVILCVYNALGQEIVTLVNEEQLPGFYTVLLNADILPSGMYIYQLRIGDTVISKKMVLSK